MPGVIESVDGYQLSVVGLPPLLAGQAVGFTGCVKTGLLIAVGFIQRINAQIRTLGFSP